MTTEEAKELTRDAEMEIIGILNSLEKATQCSVHAVDYNNHTDIGYGTYPSISVSKTVRIILVLV